MERMAERHSKFLRSVLGSFSGAAKGSTEHLYLLQRPEIPLDLRAHGLRPRTPGVTALTRSSAFSPRILNQNKQPSCFLENGSERLDRMKNTSPLRSRGTHEALWPCVAVEEIRPSGWGSPAKGRIHATRTAGPRDPSLNFLGTENSAGQRFGTGPAGQSGWFCLSSLMCCGRLGRAVLHSVTHTSGGWALSPFSVPSSGDVAAGLLVWRSRGSKREQRLKASSGPPSKVPHRCPRSILKVKITNRLRLWGPIDDEWAGK